MVQPPSRNKAGDTLADETGIDYTPQHMTTGGIRWTYHAYLFPEVAAPAGNMTLGFGTGSSNNSAPPNRLIGTVGDIARRPISAAAQQNSSTQYEYFYRTYTKWEPIITTTGPNGRPDQKHPLLVGKYRFDTTALKWKNTNSYAAAARLQKQIEENHGMVKMEPARSSSSTENAAIQELLRRYQTATIDLTNSREPCATSVEILTKLDQLLKDNSSMRNALLEQTTKINSLQLKVDYIEHITRDLRKRQQEERNPQPVQNNEAISIDGEDDETSNSEDEDESQSSKSLPVVSRPSRSMFSDEEELESSPSSLPISNNKASLKGKAPQRPNAISQGLRGLTYTPPRLPESNFELVVARR
ncbi:hypothetical protein CPB83DRAFT_658630 [Crepidotus variabilis]|uniref:Uncharacterized protein n=1 Tax=Crepidotus variabilis TaxID=179855 RepID=A0A9P6E736_9AGAR|nr:hypothetical protein CPB83DRAFT_658630 [Crepidotus variabilis]